MQVIHILRNGSLLIFSLLLFTTCKKENLCDCFKGTGSESSVTRELETFEKILVQDKIDVHLVQGAEQSVTIEGGKNVIKLIKTKVENGVLIISDDNKCDFTRSYKKKIVVYITVTNLKNVHHDGVGEVYMDNIFVTDTFRYRLSNAGDLHLHLNATAVYGGMHGNGDLYIKGLVGENVINAVGQGFYHGFDMVSNNAILTVLTSGAVEVNVNTFLKIDMLQKSTGDILYKGYPTTIYKNIKGSGRLIEKN